MPDQDQATPRLSTKDIAARDRLIVALDFPDTEAALQFVDDLGDTVSFYKLGLELFMAGGYFELIDELVARDKKVFVDLKFYDVPETVAAAVRQVKDRKATFVTVHGQDAALEAAVKVKNGSVKILAVTVLTSLDQSDIESLGFKATVEEVVLSRAQRAIELGCDGVISSGLEARALRQHHGEGFLIVAPGIRPVKNIDDQKRTVDVEEAFENGADYIVVGRPIRLAPKPKAAAEDIQERIRKIFSAARP